MHDVVSVRTNPVDRVLFGGFDDVEVIHVGLHAFPATHEFCIHDHVGTDFLSLQRIGIQAALFRQETVGEVLFCLLICEEQDGDFAIARYQGCEFQRKRRFSSSGGSGNGIHETLSEAGKSPVQIGHWLK